MPAVHSKARSEKSLQVFFPFVSVIKMFINILNIK